MFGRTPHVFGRTPPLTEGVPWGVGCFFAPTPPQNPPSPMACSRPDGRVGRTVWTDGFLDGRLLGRTVWTDGLLDGRFGRTASWTDGLLNGRFERTVWTDGLDRWPLGRTVWEGFIFGWLCQVCGWMGLGGHIMLLGGQTVFLGCFLPKYIHVSMGWTFGWTWVDGRTCHMFGLTQHLAIRWMDGGFWVLSVQAHCMHQSALHKSTGWTLGWT